MSQRNRGTETTVQMIVDGDLQGGSWAKVLDFTITPRQEVAETGFLGELEDDLDFQHSGYDFDLTVQELDDKLRDVLFDLVAREQARQAYPAVQIILTIAHRAGQAATETIVLENAKFKFDSIAIGSKKDFVTTKLSGKAKTMTRL
jgi:hypothetical protein